jgi:tetratricopeptide (TPR) repeat protein
LNPSYTTAHHWLAIALSAMGRHEEGIQEINRAKHLDPRSAIVYSASGMLLYYARRYEEAIDECRQALELDAGLVPAYKVMRWVYQATGRYDEALAAYQQEKGFSGAGDKEWPVILAQVQALANRDQSEASLKQGVLEALANRDSDFLTYEIANAYAMLGNRHEALKWLARAEAVKEHGFNFVMVNPLFDSLRRDARLTALIDKAGLASP